MKRRKFLALASATAGYAAAASALQHVRGAATLPPGAREKAETVLRIQPMTLELAPGRNPNWGPTLADLRSRLGGSDQGTFTDPRYGTKHPVDLGPWAHLPPDTRFTLQFHRPVRGSQRDRRRLAVESLLTASMPFVRDEARTLDVAKGAID